MPDPPDFVLRLEDTRRRFYELAESLRDEDWHRPTSNPKWDVGTTMFHITMALRFLGEDIFIIRHMPWLPRPPAALFHRFNEWYTSRMAKKYTRHTITRAYDEAHERALRVLDTIQPHEWEKGADYPGWDPALKGFVSIADLFQYPVHHFNDHAEEIRRAI